MSNCELCRESVWVEGMKKGINVGGNRIQHFCDGTDGGYFFFLGECFSWEPRCLP